jgi:hypothetical protein
METVILLRQCPPGASENYAVAVRDMNAVLLEKQQLLLARAEQTPLELPLPSHSLIPASSLPAGRKMTGFEAAIQEDRNALVRRQRDAQQV